MASSTSSTAASTISTQTRPETAELRLALVCYGGVSLAVYMHGVTKELYKLVQASRALDARDDPSQAENPFPSDDTTSVYFDTLKTLADRQHPLSVSIDIVGGTSAGGINGVALAKGIALNADQEGLKKVWISGGDLRQLLRAPRRLPLVLQTAWAAWNSARHGQSLLKSELMSELLRKALLDMDPDDDKPNSPATLIPKGGNLSLYVQTTDRQGFDITVPTGIGGASQRDRWYSQVLQFFASHEDREQFAAQYTRTLAFAGRVSSSFPAAFAPVSVEGFAGELTAECRPGECTTVHGQQVFRYDYAENGYTADERLFVDGGLLNNSPFDLVIDTIAAQPASRKVLRELVYIEPDPARPLDDGSVDDSSGAKSGFFGNLFALKAPATSHSFAGELIALRDLNRKIVEIGTIADLQMDEITTDIVAEIDDVAQDNNVADAGFVEKLGNQALAKEISDRLHCKNEKAMGATWNTYQRLKAVSIAHRIATAINKSQKLPPQSSTATFVTAVITEWVHQLPAFRESNEKDLGEFLQALDTPYRERRLLFIIAGINELYGTDAPADVLNKLKAQAWEKLSATKAAPDTVVEKLADSGLVATLSRFVTAVQKGRRASAPFEDPAAWAARESAMIEDFVGKYRVAIAAEIGDGSTDLWQAFASTLAGGPIGSTEESSEQNLTRLASRYLGFPRWDAILFPITSLSELPQFSPIPVSQFSPIAATALAPEGKDARKEFFATKLAGFDLAHFAAFLKTEYRENDYLWGRLDGAELILDLLNRRVVDEGSRYVPLGDAFRAILASEKGLKGVAKLRKELAGRVAERFPS